MGPRIFVIVSPDRPDLFHYFQEHFAEEEGVEVILDRRHQTPPPDGHTPAPWGLHFERREPWPSHTLVMGGMIMVEIDDTARAAPSEGGAPASEGQASSSGRMILVVDDDPMVASLLARVLEQAGHAVETAENGLFALEKLSERRYDLIVCDVRMPELDGVGLYEAVARHYPELRQRFLFVTAFAHDPEIWNFLQQTGAHVLEKPARADTLRGVVGEMLRTIQ